MKQDKIHQLNTELVDLMMKKYGITFAEIEKHLDKDGRWLIDGQDWFKHYTFTKDEEAAFRKEAIDLIAKRLKMSKKAAAQEFSWWYLFIGLSLEED